MKFEIIGYVRTYEVEAAGVGYLVAVLVYLSSRNWLVYQAYDIFGNMEGVH